MINLLYFIPFIYCLCTSISIFRNGGGDLAWAYLFISTVPLLNIIPMAQSLYFKYKTRNVK